MTYSEKLRDPRWQKMRLQIMERDDFSCCGCGSRFKTLNVHHTHYLKRKMPWEYPADSLVTLCEDCHAEIESLLPNLLKMIRTPAHALMLWRVAQTATVDEKNMGMIVELCPVLDLLAEAEFCNQSGDSQGAIERLSESRTILDYLVSCIEKSIEQHSRPSLDWLIDNAPESPEEESKV